ncbi:MAG: DJ-1/PfpI family protein [Methanocorpusculum sp.]|nr:DJ-1/PfpI family protein [Methanocorpusculum sp.]
MIIKTQMKTIYYYVLDKTAEWETGYIFQAVGISCGRAEIKTISADGKPVKTISGVTILPDASIDEISFENCDALVLPGAVSWANPKDEKILKEAVSLLNKGVLVCAICGATFALADFGVLNDRSHTSNSLECLKMFSKNYSGESFYQNKKSVADKNLITASSAGGLEFARDIISGLELFSAEFIDAWYNYYLTGEAEYFVKMMETGELGFNK